MISSIQIGQPARYEAMPEETSNKGWTTAFYKQPVEGPIALGETGLDGDGVADTRVHGGRDKAVCCYSADRFPYWRERLDKPELGAAAFGENFTLVGLTEEGVSLGDVWRVGSATVEVSQPRQPCWKLARRWRVKQLALWVQQTGYSGWYVRVVEPGKVAPGDAVEVLERPLADWTIARANGVMYGGAEDREATQALIGVAPLAESWKRQLRRRLDR